MHVGTCDVEMYYINSFLLHGGTYGVEIYYIISFPLHGTCGTDILCKIA